MKTTVRNPIRLRDLLERVEYAMTKDKTRSSLRGIHLEQDGRDLVATATDGHRLAQSRVEDLDLDLRDPFTVSAEELANIRKFLPRRGGWAHREMGAEVEGGVLVLTTSGRPRLLVHPTADPFPNVKQVIPDLTLPTIKIEGRESKNLAEVLRELATVGVAGKVELGIWPTWIALKASRPIGVKDGDEITGQARGIGTYEDYPKRGMKTFHLNGDFLADALEHVCGDVVLHPPIETGEGKRTYAGPVAVQNKAGDLAVVMPMRS